MRLKTLLILSVLASLMGCARERTEAQLDVARDHLEIRVYGRRPTSDTEYARLLKERLGVEFNPVAGCEVTNELVRDTDAYNNVMKSEIERRFGVGVLERLSEEAYRGAATRPAA